MISESLPRHTYTIVHCQVEKETKLIVIAINGHYFMNITELELEDPFINKFKSCKIKLTQILKNLRFPRQIILGLQSKYVSDQMVVLPTEL